MSGSEKIVAGLIQSEDLILDLTPRLRPIANWYEERLNDSQPLPPDLLSCTEIRPLAEVDSSMLFHADSAEPHFLEVAHWPIAESPDFTVVDPWLATRSLNVNWETMKFGVVAGDFSNDEQTEFTLQTKVEARGHAGEGIYGMKAHQDLVFSKTGEAWILNRWLQHDLFVERTSQSLFREMLAEILKDTSALGTAQRSFKDEIIVVSSRKGGKVTLPVPDVAQWEALPSTHIFPAVSVVDCNNDGRDDLFLTSQWGPTQMLEKQIDGTYIDVAREIGLLEQYMVNCVLFADIDNDGGRDAIMGRPMEPAKHLLNENGHYNDVTKTNSDLGKQYFICGISAADVNRDGLIDIHLCSYPSLNQALQLFQDVFLGFEEREFYNEKRKTENRWLDLPSSANVLLMIRGDGRLERVPFAPRFKLYRNEIHIDHPDTSQVLTIKEGQE